MNNRMIISIIVIVVVIAAGIFLLSKNNASQMHMQPATPTQMQTQGQSQTSPTSGPTVATKNAVTIQNFAFSPATLTVKVGDTVTWTNQDSAGHSATADDNSFDTGIIAQGQSGSNTFTKAGTYTYHCSVHPNMHGTIIVQ